MSSRRLPTGCALVTGVQTFALPILNAAFRAVSVAGSMPVRPRVRDIVSIRFLAAPKCCQARGARQRAYCGKLLPPRAVAAAAEAETRRGSEKTGTQCPRRIPVRPVAGQPEIGRAS